MAARGPHMEPVGDLSLAPWASRTRARKATAHRLHHARPERRANLPMMANVAPRVDGEETLHVHAASCTGEILDDTVRARQTGDGAQPTVRNGSGWLAEQCVAMAADLHPSLDKDVQRETRRLSAVGGFVAAV